jgi:L,D-transpeptidase catalytic domain
MNKENLTLKIIISKQRLLVIANNEVKGEYRISSSKYGIGNKVGSNKTPLGLHRIAGKFGRKARLGAIFKKRRDTGKVAKAGAGGDSITTRILRLEGLQGGVNKGKGIDSFRRCIYIHGTPEEKLIGSPASHGCIRMKNRDIVELFDRVRRNTLVTIKG